MEVDPNTLDASERYRLMIGSIVPRPIAFVSTVSPEGAVNLAPFSFFTGIGGSPMQLLFCPANKPDGTEKDTLRNAKPVSEGGLGQFVVNMATEDYARQVAGAAERAPSTRPVTAGRPGAATMPAWNPVPPACSPGPWNRAPPACSPGPLRAASSGEALRR